MRLSSQRLHLGRGGRVVLDVGRREPGGADWQDADDGIGARLEEHQLRRAAPDVEHQGGFLCHAGLAEDAKDGEQGLLVMAEDVERQPNGGFHGTAEGGPVGGAAQGLRAQQDDPVGRLVMGCRDVAHECLERSSPIVGADVALQVDAGTEAQEQRFVAA